MASNYTLHTGIPAYAFKNGILKNGILTKLVASFLLFCTTSSNALCSKFSQIWETLLIFKVAGWTHNRCTKIKKTLLLAMASELHPLRFELQILLRCLPLAPQQAHGDSNWKCCWGQLPCFIEEQCTCKLGEIQSELKLLFGVYYWFLKLYTRIICHSYFPLHRISQRKGSSRSRARLVKL